MYTPLQGATTICSPLPACSKEMLAQNIFMRAEVQLRLVTIYKWQYITLHVGSTVALVQI